MTIYGADWTRTGSSPVLTRLGASSGWAAGSHGQTLFNSISPWSSMRRCNLWDDGTPTAYYGDRCYTDTDVINMGQCMVDIPKFYYYVDRQTADHTQFFISDNPADTVPVTGAPTVKLHPMFYNRDGAGCIRDHIYVGAYNGYYNATTAKLESKSGVAPTGTQTLATFRGYAEARNPSGSNKWELMDFLTMSGLQLLYTVEYANFDSQGIIGYGHSNEGAIINTGDTVANGSATVGTVGTNSPLSYRGIENFYGNQNKLIDGVNLKADYKVWVADHDFATNYLAFGHPYVDSNITTATGTDNTYSKDIAVPSSGGVDYTFISASTTGGSSATYLCDVWLATTGTRIMYHGGNRASAGQGGVYYTSIAADSALTSANIGGRLMYMG